MKKLDPALRSQIEEQLRNGETVASISRATGVHINTIYQIRNMMYPNEIPADTPMPRGLTSLKEAQKIATICEMLGYDHPDVLELLANKALDIDEIKAFQEWSKNNLELCTKSTLRARARDEAKLAKQERAHQKAIEKLKAKYEKENRDLRISAELLKKAIALQGNQD
ncbi:MAG: hypothetical protein Q4A68_10625 [Anaerobiospirillum succiniciproducens]|uniref:hypothetical protein n=1 Tax=Anaerobiospirillum succiniciproducens TaxID=13335 RepID=UPI0026DC12D8|nr:hypothetical protein [Anaerobiospirillum succiniciproducens]MDO4676986.1 hypothetical protein [Anaerobiospirillum succiniciproducens]